MPSLRGLMLLWYLANRWLQGANFGFISSIPGGVHRELLWIYLWLFWCRIKDYLWLSWHLSCSVRSQHESNLTDLSTLCFSAHIEWLLMLVARLNLEDWQNDREWDLRRWPNMNYNKVLHKYMIATMAKNKVINVVKTACFASNFKDFLVDDVRGFGSYFHCGVYMNYIWWVVGFKMGFNLY